MTRFLMTASKRGICTLMALSSCAPIPKRGKAEVDLTPCADAAKIAARAAAFLIEQTDNPNWWNGEERVF